MADAADRTKADEAEDEPCCASADDAEENCCDSPPALDDGGEALQLSPLFMNFMKEANKPGLIDARAKKLMAIALSVAQRCEPCVRIHLKAAIKMGISKAEIDEAAWLAIGFAGAPAMMQYREACDELGIG